MPKQMRTNKNSKINKSSPSNKQRHQQMNKKQNKKLVILSQMIHRLKKRKN